MRNFTMSRDGILKGKTDGSDDCQCHSCLKKGGKPITIMILCGECGNKRCPKASWHAYDCTHSNEPGQPGSVYQ
jgi:hypothetical protein